MKASEDVTKFSEITIGRAMQALVLENDLLSTTIMLDQGAGFRELIYKPKATDILFRWPRPVHEPGVGPAPAADSTGMWVNYSWSAWETIFPNYGPPCEYKGALLDFHGEAGRLPWQVENVENDGKCLRVTVCVDLVKSPFRIERIMSLEAGQPILSISETITNLCPEEIETMWGHHPTFGAPFLSADCVIDTGAKTVEADSDYDSPANDLPPGQSWTWPYAQDKFGNEVDLSRVPAAGSGCSRVLYLKDFEESWYAVSNPEMQLGAGLVWDGDLCPYACLWEEAGGTSGYPMYGQVYGLAIEPYTSYPGHGLARVMATTGTQLTFAPGQSRTLDMKLVLYEGTERVARIDPAGNVQRR
jgi:galactose mutarotase-like enzyme